MSKIFSWLHLSDLHVGQSAQHLWSNFREQFHDDLRYLLQENGPFQLVVFSGDLTQTAATSEFELLNEELAKLWKVFAEFDCSPSLFAVPGNHDLSHPDSTNAQVKLLKRWTDDDDVISELFSGKENQYFDVISKSFENYSHWHSKLEIPTAFTKKGIIPGDTSSILEVNGLKIGLIGLNSSFLQLAGGDFEEQLLVSPRQLSAVTDGDPSTWCANNDFNFLVTHHPPNWFQSVARNNFFKDIHKPGRFVAHLYGHMHEAATESYSLNGGQDRRIVQASSLFGLERWGENSDHERIHGYSLNQLKVDGTSTNWTMWPRVRIENTDDDHIAPNQKFRLIRGKEYFITPVQGVTENPLSADEGGTSKVDMTSESESQQGTLALSNSLFRMIPAEHHSRIRLNEQKFCSDALENGGMLWLGANWGVGRDGFIWSVLKRLGKEKLPVYRIDLEDYQNRNTFLDIFASKMNSSFTDYCRSLANVGPSILLFDQSPTTSGDIVGKHVENEVEQFIQIAKSYLPETFMIILSTGSPKQSTIPSLKLSVLEEPDTRLYLQSQHALISEEITTAFVSRAYRLTEGLIARIDQLIRQLQVVTLASFNPPELASGRNLAVIEAAAPSLVKTITELETNTTPIFERALLLLQILTLLPNGESIDDLRHIDPTKPIFSDHALLLFDRDLVEGKNINALIGENGIKNPVQKLIFVPPQVREYVLSRMDVRLKNKLIRLAADHYFGKNWNIGNHRRGKLLKIVEHESVGAAGNPHSLLLRMLGDKSFHLRPMVTSSILKICVAYCSELYEADQFRRLVSVALEIISFIPDQYIDERNIIEINLAKALRMSGEHDRALPLLEKLLLVTTAKNTKVSLLLNKALCMHSLGNADAIDVAREIVKISPKSSNAFHAKTIILEIQDDEEKEKLLLQIEQKSRQGGHTMVANNLALNRIDNYQDPSATKALRMVYESSMKNGETYNAHRAATKIAHFTFKQTGNIAPKDLKKLISAYHYFYGERFGTLFTSSHKVLWEYFDSNDQVGNLLALYRHSSFVWRLNGQEHHDKKYFNLLEGKRNNLITLGEPIDKNILYFLSRSEYQFNRIEGSKKNTS